MASDDWLETRVPAGDYVAHLSATCLRRVTLALETWNGQTRESETQVVRNPGDSSAALVPFSLAGTRDVRVKVVEVFWGGNVDIAMDCELLTDLGEFPPVEAFARRGLTRG